jgi:hypothetical protein
MREKAKYLSSHRSPVFFVLIMWKNARVLVLGTTLAASWVTGGGSSWSLPPPEDVPEEVLRTEIVTSARSPIDGKWLTAAEYAELQAQLQIEPPNPQVSPKVRELIFLVRLRKLLRSIGVPIK